MNIYYQLQGYEVGNDEVYGQFESIEEAKEHAEKVKELGACDVFKIVIVVA